MDRDASQRRRSKEGYRKVDMKDRMLIFLSLFGGRRLFPELGYQFGRGKETARQYFVEIVDLFNTHFVPRCEMRLSRVIV